jgi:uncharacterized protein (TIGR02246 family)
LLLLAAAVLLPATAAEPAPAEPAATDPPPAAAGEAAAAPDLDVLRAEVEAAERRYNRAARERDRETFHGLLTKDTVFLAGELHAGRLAVMAVWQPLFDGKYDFRYDAETLESTVARSGEWAWSVGSVETRYQRPGVTTEDVTESDYLHVWSRDEDGEWRLAYNSTLVVHPSLGAARDPRSGLMTPWPELADQIGARIEIRWNPEKVVRAESGEMAYTFGVYEASFTPPSATGDGDDAAGDDAADDDPAGDDAAGDGDNGADADADADADAETIAGEGHFLAVWEKDDAGHWQLAAEGFTPPGIYGDR